MKKLSQFLLFATFFVIFLLINSGCNKDDNPVLSAARDLEGTWKTTFPVKFYIMTDFCTNDLELVATEYRSVTMIITGGSDENHVNIQINHTDSNFTVVNPNCTNGAGYVPDVSPNFYKGVISGTRLSIVDDNSKEYGKFNFTTDLMEGTWRDAWCMVYCQTVYTDTNQLKLTLQH